MELVKLRRQVRPGKASRCDTELCDRSPVAAFQTTFTDDKVVEQESMAVPNVLSMRNMDTFDPYDEEENARFVKPMDRCSRLFQYLPAFPFSI